MANHRLFLGVALPPELQESLTAFMREHQAIPGIRWTRPTNLHLTTIFLGETPEDILPNLISLFQVGIRRLDPFSLEVSQLQVAPRPTEPRMIWLRFHKVDAFKQAVWHLHDLLDPVVEVPQQFRKSPTPHITLGRITDSKCLSQIDLTYPIERSEMQVNEMTLWESIQTPTGHTYQEITRFMLG